MVTVLIRAILIPASGRITLAMVRALTQCPTDFPATANTLMEALALAMEAHKCRLLRRHFPLTAPPRLTPVCTATDLTERMVWVTPGMGTVMETDWASTPYKSLGGLSRRLFISDEQVSTSPYRLKESRILGIVLKLLSESTN